MLVVLLNQQHYSNTQLLFMFFFFFFDLSRYEVRSYNNEVDIWFSNAIGRPCTLLRSSGSQSYSCINKNGSPGMCRDVGARLNFVNEAQFLLVSEESIADLNSRLKSSMSFSSSPFLNREQSFCMVLNSSGIGLYGN